MDRTAGTERWPIAEADGNRTRLTELLGQQDPPTRKGSLWALSFAEGRLVDADHLPHPLA